MKFIDEISIRVEAGDGGPGASSFRREAHTPRGGPDGGNGGDGGAVIFKVDRGVSTLAHLAFSPTIRAKNGEAGAESRSTGSSGEDRLVRVPEGTQVFFGERLVADLDKPGAVWVAARGGRGGKGNEFYKSSTNRSPDTAQPGIPGEKFEFRLVLKSVADIGLIGLPNVGKSSLVNVLSNSKALVADYPFSTLTPNLGVVGIGEDNFVVADIPGLVPGAHLGKGIGDKFLKHIERTKILVLLIDPSTLWKNGKPFSLESEEDVELLKDSTYEQLELITGELEKFSPKLSERIKIVVFSKGDRESSGKAFEICKAELKKRGFMPMLVSTTTNSGVAELKMQMFQLVNDLRR